MYKHIIIMVISFIIAVCGNLYAITTSTDMSLSSIPTPDDIAYFVYSYPYIGWSIIIFLRSFVIFITHVECRESGNDITHLPAVITDFVMGLSVFLYSCYAYVVDHAPFQGLGAVVICFSLLPLPVIFLIIDVILSIIERKNWCRKGWK